MSKIETGRAAEDLALERLSAAGMKLVERNFRAKAGEIDLVMREGEEIVFVEVRARASDAFGGAAASITAAKQRRVIAAARLWLVKRGWTGSCRFDVVAIEAGRVEHLRAAFEA